MTIEQLRRRKEDAAVEFRAATAAWNDAPWHFLWWGDRRAWREAANARMSAASAALVTADCELVLATFARGS